ncbi:MAG TPA: Pr6Pr family membrane protein [Candidatus Binatia bacterium]|nr:Pr6Pr family membrane protein [Candidatus Binatia bacterium]
MRIPSAILRLARTATALIAIAAIVIQAMTLVDAGRLDLVNFLSFFTIQSNLIAIAALLILAARTPGPRPRWLEWLRGAATVYLTITFFVVILLLQGIDVGLQLAWVDFVLHKLTPIVIVADWLLDPPTVRLTRRDALGWLIYPLVWLGYTMVRGALVDWYPYPFLNPANGGDAQVAVTSLVILAAGTVVCLFFAWLGNRVGGNADAQPAA